MIARTVALILLTCVSVARSQSPDPPPFRLDGLPPTAPRTSVSTSWGTLPFTLTNLSDTARDARVMAFYADQPDVQYGRDVWLPPQSAVTSWLTVGPASAEGQRPLSRELRYQLYERSGNQLRLIQSGGDERLRSRSLPYQKREPSTSLLTDSDSLATPSLQFTRVFRLARGLSEIVTPVRDRFLHPTPDAFDGTDQVVIAGNRIAQDPIGLRTIRQWVLSGGTVWVMLDQVDLATVAPILGDDCGFEVVNRTSLTSVRLVRSGDDASQVKPREYDHAVDLVRVRLGGNETVHYTVNGWPAVFSQTLGRGKVVVTTLGGPAWFRSRTAREKRSGFEHHPDLPVPHPELERLAADIYPEPVPIELKPADFEPLVTAEIGYSIVSLPTAGAILIGFIVCLFGAGLAFRWTRRPERIGWLAPILAVAAAALFVGYGLNSRRSVPPTVSVVSVVEAVPGIQEGHARGLAAVYRPEAGSVRIAADASGLVLLDSSGLEGQTRQLIQTDSATRTWDNVSLPVGVRTGSYHGPVSHEGLKVVVQYGPDGLSGTFTNGQFLNPTDSVLVSPSSEVFGIRSLVKGEFSLSSIDRLPTGEFFNDSVLTDRQQRRRDVYRKLFTPTPRHLVGRTHLLTWVDAPSIPVSAENGERVQSATLLVIPVDFRHTPPDTKVTIPLGCVPFALAGPGKLTMESPIAIDQALRFQLPPSTLPLTVERATLVLKIHAPGRLIEISGRADGAKKLLHQTSDLIDPIRIDVTDASLLEPDADGGLRFNLAVRSANSLGAGGRTSDLGWRIESLAMEVVGRTGLK